MTSSEKKKKIFTEFTNIGKIEFLADICELTIDNKSVVGGSTWFRH
jgi:hypothetical protein